MATRGHLGIRRLGAYPGCLSGRRCCSPVSGGGGPWWGSKRLTTAPPSLLLSLLFTRRRWATRHRIHIHTLDLLSSFGICCSPATYCPSRLGRQGTPRWEPRFPLRLLLLLVRQVTGVCLGLPPTRTNGAGSAYGLHARRGDRYH